MATVSKASGRRGRLPASERVARQQAVLDCALEELLENGVDGLSMLGVAQRAGASKETLYSWFDSREGLLTALIERNADGAADRVREALEREAHPTETLVGFGIGLLTLLTSPASIALNRAAMTTPELAHRLLASGRFRVGPIVEHYLASITTDKQLNIADPAAAFELLYGLLIQDTQIRVLLGDDPPSPADIKARAKTAVEQFFALVGEPP